jgi:hypothetical protein
MTSRVPRTTHRTVPGPWWAWLAALPLLALAFSLAFPLWVRRAVMRDEGFQRAKQLVFSDPGVRAKLGVPLKLGVLTSGETEHDDATHVSIDVTGPKGRGVIEYVGDKTHVEHLRVLFQTGGEAQLVPARRDAGG